MIPRYSRKEITEVWDPKNKFQISIDELLSEREAVKHLMQ